MPSFTEGKKIFMIVQEIKKHQRKAIAPEGIAEKQSSSLGMELHILVCEDPSSCMHAESLREDKR
jgi:hypothetical protein